jgi:hypothetical protein
MKGVVYSVVPSLVSDGWWWLSHATSSATGITDLKGQSIIKDLYISYKDDEPSILGDVESRPNRRRGLMIFHLPRPKSPVQMNASSQTQL